MIVYVAVFFGMAFFAAFLLRKNSCAGGCCVPVKVDLDKPEYVPTENVSVGLIVASEGFHPVEYFDTKKELQAAGYKVVTISDKSGIARSADGPNGIYTTEVDVTLDNVNLNMLKGLFIIGGPGTMDCLDNSKTYSLVQDANARNLFLGAICIGPRILAKAKVLNGKKATGWDGDEKLDNIFETPDYNVARVHQSVVRDGSIITADGPSSAKEFGKTIVAVLGQER